MKNGHCITKAHRISYSCELLYIIQMVKRKIAAALLCLRSLSGLFSGEPVLQPLIVIVHDIALPLFRNLGEQHATDNDALIVEGLLGIKNSGL